MLDCPLQFPSPSFGNRKLAASLSARFRGEQRYEKLQLAILDARAQFPQSSLADLYDPLTMPSVLVKAHQALDRTVDACYRKAAFTNDAQRVEFLFERYQQITSLLLAGKKRQSGKQKHDV